jgi:hypothetical protein
MVRPQNLIRVAHASRVLVLASRQNSLPAVIADIAHDSAEKFATAGRTRQHARRARYPDKGNSTRLRQVAAPRTFTEMHYNSEAPARTGP